GIEICLQHQQRPTRNTPAFEGLGILFGAQQARTTREPRGRGHGRSRRATTAAWRKAGLRNARCRLDSQALAALGAAGIDNGTAAGGLHADTETMGALAAGYGRLVSTLHDGLEKRRARKRTLAAAGPRLAPTPDPPYG